jgi:hypothetical protein
VEEASVGDIPTRDALTKAWGDSVLAGLRGRAKALFAVGRFLAVENGAAVFALPNAAHRDQCVPIKADVEQALAAHFGRPIPLQLVADQLPVDDAGPFDDAASFDPSEMRELRDAPKAAPSTPADRVKSAFPGAEEVDR